MLHFYLLVVGTIINTRHLKASLMMSAGQNIFYCYKNAWTVISVSERRIDCANFIFHKINYVYIHILHMVSRLTVQSLVI